MEHLTTVHWDEDHHRLPAVWTCRDMIGPWRGPITTQSRRDRRKETVGAVWKDCALERDVWKWIAQESWTQELNKTWWVNQRSPTKESHTRTSGASLAPSHSHHTLASGAPFPCTNSHTSCETIKIPHLWLVVPTPPTEKVMFSPIFCLCLFVCRISQKVVDGSGWNFVDRLGVWQGWTN